MDNDKSADPLNVLESLAASAASSEVQLRQAFRSLEVALGAALAGANVSATSDHVFLWDIGEDDHAHGVLCFGQGKLTVRYYSTENSMEYVMGRGLVPAEPQYHEAEFDKIYVDGLHGLAKDVRSLMDSLISSLQAQINANNEATTGIFMATREAQSALADTLMSKSSTLNYAAVAREWSKAQSAIEVDPARAVTAARSLVESVCKHILHDLAAPEPESGRELKMGRYLKAAVEAFRADRNTALDGATTMLTKFNAIVTAIAELRNEAGDAHGRSPLARAPSTIEARLAVNSAGVLATGLMETLQQARVAARLNEPAVETIASSFSTKPDP